jgi:hypothetical protein
MVRLPQRRVVAAGCIDERRIAVSLIPDYEEVLAHGAAPGRMVQNRTDPDPSDLLPMKP